MATFDAFKIGPGTRPIVTSSGELPGLVARQLERNGYWPLHLECTGEPDPGVVTLWVPGELLEQLPRILNSGERSALEKIELDPASLERAIAEWRAQRRNPQGFDAQWRAGVDRP